MSFDSARRRAVFDRTSGRCHICGKKLSFTNYAIFGAKGSWEVEHSHPQTKGGTDHGNNLYAACISCNREKGALTTRTARSWHGRTKAPLSKEGVKEARRSNALVGGLLGGLAGLTFGPWGAGIGAAVGAKIGHDVKPK